MKDETHLIEQARAGSQHAYKALYKAHVTPLYRFLRQYSADAAEVEDWTQRAFVKAFMRLDTFRGASRFSTWLFTLGLNEMRMDKRRAAILPMNAVFDEDYSASATEADARDFEWRDAMKTWLEQLSDVKRSVFVLYEVEGYSHTEIAQILGIQESASRTILTRVKSFLREQWNEHFAE